MYFIEPANGATVSGPVNVRFGLKGMGVSILLVEQNARMALSISDWGYVLESGRVVESGAAADLGNSPRVREIYLGA